MSRISVYLGMRFFKVLYVVGILFFATLTYGQEVSGHVFDKKTKSPIVGASVYFASSSIGTVTDVDGNFTIKLPYQGNVTLVIRNLGYQTHKITNPEQNLQIALQEEIEKLEEVVLTSDPFSRRQKLEVFRLEFLGDSDEARSCKILNEDDVELYFNTSNNTLSAYCKRPLKVQNDFLRYYIIFDVEEFQIHFKNKSLERIDNIHTTYFKGSTFFVDRSKEDLKTAERRADSYLGSSMHFLRACWYGDVLNQNFVLKKGFKEIAFEDFVSVNRDIAKDLKNLKFSDDSFVIYHKKRKSLRLRSTIQIVNKETPLTIDRYGSYRPDRDLIFGGHMADLRVAHMLPIDYGL